jgi:hypothetical protein
MADPYRGLLSSTFDNKIGEFINTGNRIQVIYGTTNDHSHYDAATKTIYMVDRDVQQTATTTNVSYDQAYAQILVHELGHWVYNVGDTMAFGSVNTAADFKQWFFTREGEASIFGAGITAEVRDNGGAFRVAGTSNINDLFSKSNAAVENALNSPSADVFGTAAKAVGTYFSQDSGYQTAANNALSIWSAGQTNYIPASFADSYADYSGGGCVEVESALPCGRIAGAIIVGDELELADEESLQASQGRVSYSCKKFAQGFKITTTSGVQLVCSDTAPIPVQKGGTLNPAEILGEFVAVRVDEDGISRCAWEKVVSVDPVGQIAVQHITVGDRSFWAGRIPGKYILHHNMKMGPGPGDGGGGWDWGWDYLSVDPAPLDHNTASGLYDEYGRPKVILVGSDGH